MSKTYVIHWTSKLNGRVGQGAALFEKDEAERLAGELNRDYSDIHHQAVPAPAGAAPEPAPGIDSVEPASVH
jgi:hypothetical protein